MPVKSRELMPSPSTALSRRNINGDIQVRLGDLGPIGALFLARAGIIDAPDPFDSDGDFPGRGTLRCAFEEHVFDEVGCSALFVRFVGGSPCRRRKRCSPSGCAASLRSGTQAVIEDHSLVHLSPLLLRQAEAIPHSPHCSQVAAMIGILFYLLPQPADVDFQRPGISKIIRFPNLLHQKLTGQNLLRIAHEYF